jgi:3-oxoacyl-[acyl-carrier-protein] synthase III
MRPTIRLEAGIAMLVGEVFLEAMSTGIVTQAEIDWLTIHQARFSREEEAKALQLGRLLEAGQLQIGCRILGNTPA